MILEISLHTYPSKSSLAQSNSLYCYSLTGFAEPGLMSRIMELWIRRGLLLGHSHEGLTGPAEDDMCVDIGTPELDPLSADTWPGLNDVSLRLSQVLLSKKPGATTA